jgi:hypothetical protein
MVGLRAGHPALPLFGCGQPLMVAAIAAPLLAL